MQDRKNGMKQRMAALTALCLTGTLLLSGGWSQTALASTVSDVTSGLASDGTSDAADGAQTADAAPSADGAQEEAPADGQEEALADGAQEETPADAQETSETEQQEAPEADQPEEALEGQQETDGQLLEDEQRAAASYKGITIDGDFSDWDAISKVSVDEKKGWDTVDEVAMVWDGDYVYLYFMAAGNGDGSGDWGSVCSAGSHNNGQYAITTDLGRILPIQLKKNGNTPAVGGVDGASAAVNNTNWSGAPHMWEAAIPTSALPEYKNTISFGLYQGQTFISDVANLQGDPDGEDKTFNGIVYDGQYGDWKYYPHELIEYATAGTHEHVADAEAAMYSANGLLYAHVVTNMSAHLKEAGGEFTAAVTIRFNEDENKSFWPQFVAVDADGTINYQPTLKGLAPGTYEFYMIDSQGWKTATNISQFEEAANEEENNAYGNKYHNAVFGRMYVTVGSSEDNMEYEADLSVLARRFGMEADEIRTVSGQWGRIGQQWVHTAGTPTGAGVGLFLCLSTTGLAYIAQRKKKKQV